MAYRFHGATVETLERDRMRRDRLRMWAERHEARIRPGRPPERSLRRPQWRVKSGVGVPDPPPAAVIALTRLGFGPRPGDVADFDALGATDPQRLEAWLDQQLDPPSIDDSAADARLAASGFQTLDKSLVDLWADHVVPPDLPWEERQRPAYEVALATMVRAVHSRRQLFEVLVGFWHDHFNVYAWDYPAIAIWPSTDRDAIRAHALGNFRDMIEAVAKTPTMLFYLDNYLNSEEDANENYARELLELHAMGADAYLGSLAQGDVPLDPQGRPIGWVEDDVVAVARCFTGWTVDLEWFPLGGNTGTFLYWDPWHDHDPKHVLGVDLPANQPPLQDGYDLLDLVAQHPATGRFVAGKLARRLLGDSPPESVVEAAAAVFTAEHAAPDQLAQVVRTIVLAPEFLATWGDKVKRPFDIAMSALRGAGGDLPFEYQEDSTQWFLWQLYTTGHFPFGWHPPDGYPDVKSAWNTTSPRVMSWRLANFLATARDAADVPFADILGQTPPDVRSAYGLVAFWGERVLGRPLPPDEHDQLVLYMAQGHNPHFDLPLDSDESTRERLRALVALILMSPSFLWR
jgi:uncharacterized protein (DUF1800 family)